MKTIVLNCHICRNATKWKENEQPIETCVVCGTNLRYTDSETLVKQTGCNVPKQGPGVIYLTNHRLFWVKTETDSTQMWFGLLGVLIRHIFGGKAKAPTMLFNIDLNNITKIEDSKAGLSKGITVFTQNGESYQFMSGKLQKWDELARFRTPIM